ncbi:hypothetical protein BGZ92_008194 [Podila epicladia]|nr:hypothetical protein BGZ92_008194 [Podila epicladia]
MDIDYVTNPTHSSPLYEDIPNTKVQHQQAMSLVHVDPASTPSSRSDQEASHPRISVSLHAASQDHSPAFVFTHDVNLGTPQPHSSLSSDKSSEYESEDEFSSEDHECEEQEGEKEQSEDDDSLDEPLILQAGRMAHQNSSKPTAPSSSLKNPVLNTLRHSPAFGYSRIPRKPVGVGYSPQHALNRLEVENAYLISQNTSLNRDIQHCRNTVMALKQIVAQKEEIIEQMRHEHRQACLKAKFMESVLAEYHDARNSGHEPRSIMHESYSRIQHKIHPVAKFNQGAHEDEDLSYSDMDNSEFGSDEEDYENQNDGDHENDYDGSDGGQHPSNLIHSDDHFVQISLDDNPNHLSTSDTESEPILDSPQLRRRPRQSLSSVIPFGSSSRLQSTFSGFTLAIPGPPASDTPESDLGDAHTGLCDGQFSMEVFNIGIEDNPEETASESTLTPTTIKESDLDLDLDVPQEKNNGDTFDPTTKNIPAPQPNSGLYTKTVTSPSIYLACVNIEATGSSGSLAEHSPSSEGGSTLSDTSPDQDSKDHLSATSTITTLPTDDDSIELCPAKRNEQNRPIDPETVSIASARPTSPSTILTRLWQGVGRQTASFFGRRSAPKSKHSSHNKGLSSQAASGVRVTKIGIRRIGSRSRFRSLTTSPVSVTVSGGAAMTDMQVDS